MPSLIERSGWSATGPRDENDIPLSGRERAEIDRSLWLCVAIVAAVFLGSLVGIRFVNPDDIWSDAWRQSGDWLATAWALAVHNGSLFTLASVDRFVPYFLDSRIYYAIVHFGSILVAAWMFGRLLASLIGIDGTALLFGLLFFAFAQNSWESNLFSANPFQWELGWIAVLGALWLLVRAIERQNMRYAMVGAVVFALGLVDGFVPYILLFAVVACWGSRERARANLDYLRPYLFATVIWVVAWLWWRMANPPVPDAALAAGFSVVRAVKTLFIFSMGGMPFATIWENVADMSARAFAEGVGVASAAKAICVGFATLQLARLLRQAPEWTPRPIVMRGMIALIFLPNVVVALTPKFQQWMEAGAHGYVQSHFSYFAWIGLICLLLIRLLQRFRMPWIVWSVAIACAIGSIVTDWSNAEVNLQQRLSAKKWTTFDRFLASAEYQALPENATIQYRGLDVARGNAVTDAAYWTYYAKARTGKTVQFVSDPEEAAKATGDVYALAFDDEQRGESQTIVFAKVDRGTAPAIVSMAATALGIYPNSPADTLLVSGRLPCADGLCSSTMLSNGAPVPVAPFGLFATQLSAQADANGIPRIAVDLPEPMDVRLASVTSARSFATMPGLEIKIGDGFYGWEQAGDRRWNWAQPESTLVLENPTGKTVDAQMKLVFGAADTRTVDITITSLGIMMHTDLTPDIPHPQLLRFNMPAGTTMIELKSKGEPYKTGTEDKRLLAFRVEGLELRSYMH